MAETVTVWKEWHGGTRPSHAAADGERVPIDDNFSMGCSSPGNCDSGEEAANCACFITIEVEGAPATTPTAETVLEHEGIVDEDFIKTVTDEVQKAVTTIQADSGLASRWSGKTIIRKNTSMNPYDAIKAWECDIHLAAKATRWSGEKLTTTITHEMVHSVSVSPKEVFTTPGYGMLEEGAVEMYARILVRASSPSGGPSLTGGVYQRAITQLEEWRKMTGMADAAQQHAWYRNLIQTPLKDRPRWIADQVKMDPDDIEDIMSAL